MVIPVIPIIVAIIILALLWWVTSQFVVDAFLLKVARVVIVTICVLWIVSVLSGYGPSLSFR
jgi:uncharacterized membrane protein YwzB